MARASRFHWLNMKTCIFNSSKVSGLPVAIHRLRRASQGGRFIGVLQQAAGEREWRAGQRNAVRVHQAGRIVVTDKLTGEVQGFSCIRMTDTDVTHP